MTISVEPSPRTDGGTSRHRSVRSPRIRRAFALSAIGVAAVTLAACGSSSSASPTSSTAAPSNNGGGAGSGSNGSGTGGSEGRAPQFPGASGSIAAINGTSLEVQSPTSGQTTVTYTATTVFDQTVSATAADVTVGSCVSAFGKPTSTSSSNKSVFGQPVTATTVTISQPTSGTCTGGFGRAGSSGATGAAGATPPAGGFPTGGSGQRPQSGGGFRGRFGGGQFGAASGAVTAVTGSTLTLSETDPSTKKTSSVVVTLTSSTKFTQRAAASASDLAVGKCAQATGQASTTGAITARSIAISLPVSGSCATGFGGFGRGGAGGPGGGGSAGAGPSGGA